MRPRFYLITVTAASAMWSDYSPVSQTVSELIAINAPTRLYVAILFTIYALLIYAYGVGVMLSSNGKRTLITMILFVIFGILAGLDQPKYALNMPTPMMGIWERINIYGYMLWVVIFSILLLRLNRGNTAKHIKVSVKKPLTMVSIIMDMFFSRTPKVQPAPDILRQYDFILFFGPVWMGQAASPLRAYLNERIKKSL